MAIVIDLQCRCLTGIRTYYNHAYVQHTIQLGCTSVDVVACVFGTFKEMAGSCLGQMFFIVVPVLRSCGYPRASKIGNEGHRGVHLSKYLPKPLLMHHPLLPLSCTGHWWATMGTPRPLVLKRRIISSQSMHVVDGIS